MTPRQLATREEGVIAIEFAFILPILLILIVGTFEISKYIQTNNQVVQVVSMVGQMSSQLPATTDVTDVQRIWSASPLIAPEAQRVAANLKAQRWSDVLNVTITSIVFTKRVPDCQSNCVYDAQIAWSVGQNPVSCGTIPSGNPILPTQDVIPAELYGQGSVISVRASLSYLPYLIGTSDLLAGLASSLSGQMTESSWFLPRNADRTALTGLAAATPQVRLCPGIAS
ncbi:hypothetical protein NS365_11090 [Aureimonas ureilytica]|uniref:TadE-like domain-containing protein n=1 Tax=Aureimonas ureilytica TaxID=401562 RepID=A0A175RPB6_9HYPH|nr:TadE/TadG family type IV pilus assembly protein [Aureimonas ureilytica]KTR05546.1 hypothetical protein NS365_11090 [Aureimonas ureilytica]